jgi:transcriptional regulator GlxA family with amidase domain
VQRVNLSDRQRDSASSLDMTMPHALRRRTDSPPSDPANTCRDVGFVLFDGVAATDVIGPADVLSSANQASPGNGYRLHYIGTQPTVQASNRLRMHAEPLQTRNPHGIHTLVVPGADEPALRAAMADDRLVDWIRISAGAAHRVCSVCSGSFLLARAGVLDGLRVTTHWRGLDELAKLPGIGSVEREALYVEQGRIWTSAGVTAGIDMMLAIVERDLGQRVAMAVAREMVLFLVRPGNQTQFSAPLDLQSRAQHSDLRRLPPWLELHLGAPISVNAMAEAMAMSERTLYRRCIEVFGLTPLALLQRLRLDRARLLLEDPSRPLKDVARQSGVGDVGQLGKLFKTRFGVSPSEYRQRFSRPLGD